MLRLVRVWIEQAIIRQAAKAADADRRWRELHGELSASPAPQCDEETRSWDHFTPEQADLYWIRCTLSGPHDEHQDSATGLTWRSEVQS